MKNSEETFSNMQLTVKRVWTIRMLTIAAAFIVFVSLACWWLMQHGELRVKVFRLLFDLQGEGNIPAFFSGLLFVLASVLFLTVHMRERLGKAMVSGWSFQGLLFGGLAFDEGGQIHEKFNKSMKEMLGGGDLGVLDNAWVVPYSVLVLLLAMWTIPFLLKIDRRTAVGMFISAILFLGGAMGMELVEGALKHLPDDSATSVLTHALEESLEMAGLIFLIHTLLKHLARKDAILDLRFQ